MMPSQKTCLKIAYCFFGLKEGYVPVSAYNGETLATGYIGEESDMSCFSVRCRSAVSSPYDAALRTAAHTKPATLGLSVCRFVF